MVTLRQIAETIDKSSANESTPEIDKISQDLNVELYWAEQDRLKSYWIGGWNCTDTWVGYKMYFLDDEPVGVSSQTARKSDVEFEWFGNESADKVRDYLLTLAVEEKPNVNTTTLDEEIGEGYRISFNSQIVHGNNATLNGKNVKVIERIKHTEWGIDTLVVVQFEDGSTETVNVEELLFKFNLEGLQNK